MRRSSSRAYGIGLLTFAAGCNAVFGINKPTLDDGSDGGGAGKNSGSGGASGNAGHGGTTGSNGGQTSSNHGGGFNAVGGSDSGGVPGDAGGSNGGADGGISAGGGVTAGAGVGGSGGVTAGGGTTAGGGVTNPANGGTAGSSGGVLSAGGGNSASGGKAAGGTTAMGGTSAAGGTGAGGKAGGSGGAVATNGGTGSGGAGSGGKASGGAGSGGAASGGAGGINCSGPSLTGGTQHCAANYSNTLGGYTYSIWSNTGTGCITPYGVGAAFNATWNNSGDVIARMGLQWDGTKPYDQLGTLVAQLAYTRNGTAGGYSYIGVYGWSVSPCVEWFIIDDSYNVMPINPGGTTNKGTVTIDGDAYTLYTRRATGSGNSKCGAVTDWPQFYSVRHTARRCGQISLTQHFAAWKAADMVLGNMDQAQIFIEVGGGSGAIDFSTANVTAQ